MAGFKILLEEVRSCQICAASLPLGPRPVLQAHPRARIGFYLRVLEEGEVGEGDLFEQVKTEPERMSVSEACHLLYFDQKNLEGAQKALRIQALSPGWKGSFKDRLTKTRAPIEYSEEPAEGEKCCGP